MANPKMTGATLRLLQAFLDAPNVEHYGLELLNGTGLNSGTLYPILGRLERAGWLRSGWEDINESVEGRPRRRYYAITALGADSASAAVARQRAARTSTKRRVQLRGAG